MKKKFLLGFIAGCFLLAAVSILTIEISAQSKKDLRRAESLTKEGDKAFLAKDYRRAIKKYSEAVTIAPTFADAHFWKGYAHYLLNEYDEALTEFNLVSAQNIKNPLALYRLRWSLNYQKKNYDLALEDVQKGLALEQRISSGARGL
jgi:tetratricopeptide (TPR) repeat protein